MRPGKFWGGSDDTLNKEGLEKFKAIRTLILFYLKTPYSVEGTSPAKSRDPQSCGGPQP